MSQTALTQLKQWIVKFEKVNGTPTICEIKAQIEMFKKIEKDQIIDAYADGRISVINKEIISYKKYFDSKFND